MTTLHISPNLAERLAVLAQSRGTTQEQLIAQALDTLDQEQPLRPIPELSQDEIALFTEIGLSEKFSDEAIIQRYGMKAL